MSIDPSSVPEETPRDREEELTELEYKASQGRLEAAEQQRLDQLHQQSNELVQENAEQADHVTPGSPVVSGDDSP